MRGWYVHFGVGSWLRCIYRGDDVGHLWFDELPPGFAQYYDSNFEVL